MGLALGALALLLAVNLIAVGVFGEFEFWFAIIKMVTIVGMIVLGLATIVLGISDLSHTSSFSNLWSHGGFFAKGFKGPFLALQIVMFAFLGVELIGVTAGEAQNPGKTIPSAIHKVIWRVLVFYIGALLIIMSLVAWNNLNPSQSPFVVVFSKVGIPTAAGIINFVVLTVALSSCNSGIFSTGRMLNTLAGFRQAPAALRKRSRGRDARCGCADRRSGHGSPPQLLGAYRAARPDVRFHLLEGSSGAMRTWLSDGEVDLILTSPRPAGREFAWAPLLREQLLLAVPSGHRLAGRRQIRLRDVADEPFVTLKAGFATRALADELCARAGFEPKIAVESQDPTTVRSLVAAGLGLALVPAPHATGPELRPRSPTCRFATRAPVERSASPGSPRATDHPPQNTAEDSCLKTDPKSLADAPSSQATTARPNFAAVAASGPTAQPDINEFPVHEYLPR